MTRTSNDFTLAAFAEAQSVRAVEAQADGAIVRAGGEHEVVLQTIAADVVDEVNAAVKLAVADGGERGEPRAPPRGVAADRSWPAVA